MAHRIGAQGVDALTQKIKDEIEGWCDGHQFQVIWNDDGDNHFDFESLRLTVQGEEALRKLLLSCAFKAVHQ